MARHGRDMRGDDDQFTSRFGYLFQGLPAYVVEEKYLTALAATMVEPEDTNSLTIGPKHLPAGYTYLGQLIDHDLTFDAASLSQRRSDQAARVNFRSPFLDLDCLYGRGVVDQPYLYNTSKELRGLFLVDLIDAAKLEFDVPRNASGTGILADPRNDANLIVSQLHLAFMQYHNKVFAELSDAGTPHADRFEATADIVRQHYQWMILEDYLPRIVRRDELELRLPSAPFRAGQDTWRVNIQSPLSLRPFMPMEFSAAAFRFGHSMVRSMYFPNRKDRTPGLPVFDRTQPDNDAANDFRGFRRRPLGMTIDWAAFFPLDDGPMQLARPIDTLLAHPLVSLPSKVAGQSQRRSLPFLNLTRGLERGLPSGQDVAKHLGVKNNVIGRDVRFRINQTGFTGDLGDVGGTGISLDELERKFETELPLWYYVLKEAEIVEDGNRLGPVGSAIVVEVLLGLLSADPFSILLAGQDFRPRSGQFGCVKDRSFTIVDLLRYTHTNQ